MLRPVLGPGGHNQQYNIFHFSFSNDGWIVYSNDMIQILRYRYFLLRDLVGRPFVQLYANASEPLDINPTLRARVLSLASQSGHYSMLKLSQIAVYRNHGTWFTLRNTVSAVLVLWSIDLAHRCSWTSRAQLLVPPDGLRSRVYEVAQRLRPYWNSWGGAALAIKNTIQLVLERLLCD